MTVMTKPSPSNSTANMRGAVPAPNENPCMPCRSLDAQRANTAIAISAIPPTKSCGPRTHFGIIELTGPWLGVSLIVLSPQAQGLLAHSLDSFAAAPTVLPTDFRQITPAKPKQPPATNNHSGLSRVAKASTAAVAVTRPAAQVRSEVSAKISALAPIKPIERGTSAARMMAGQRDRLDRAKRRL